MCRKLLISTIVSNPTDRRYYARVRFLNFEEFGLLDTGANISCIGSDLALNDFSKFPKFFKCKSFVKTADGKTQPVLGWLDVEISFQDTTKPIKLFIIPAISQRLILGIDFWNTFALLPDLVGPASIVFVDPKSKFPASLSPISEESDILSDAMNNSTTLGENLYPLTSKQRQQLNAVTEMFPNFEREGLGRTSLIKHRIDVGDAIPVKQRFYPVSPAVEKLMFTEIDRMLALGVIELSTSSWSSPMRLVVKPGKVRLGR